MAIISKETLGGVNFIRDNFLKIGLIGIASVSKLKSMYECTEI